MAVKKTKVITFEEQLKKMEEDYGIPSQDSLNVISGLVKVVESTITEETSKDTEDFEIQTPLGFIGFSKVDASERINTADGTKFTAPAHYVGNYAFPNNFINLANANVDFSQIPNISDIQSSKTKTKVA